MLFSSYVFLFAFLPITLSGYFLTAKYLNRSAAKVFLVIASLVFYAQWNEKYLLLIGGSILFNFFLGDLFLNPVLTKLRRKFYYLLGIIFNLGLLAYFKYFDFFILNANSVLGLEIPLQNILLPLAISFFTFQQIAFLTERFKGATDKYSFVDYSLFVVFFPQLIAGPIVQPKDTLRQFSAAGAERFNSGNVLAGLVLFSIGVFKKVVIADSFVATVGAGFDVADAGLLISSIDAWLLALAYSFQLYFDFSGYTDMALGLGLLFNIRLPINFNSPYKALSIQDFWRRWHITLSNFLRDHLYIPMGGNRKKVSRTYVNLFTTFLLGGLWHGAGWTFVIWGAMHGFGLCIHRFWSGLGFKLPKLLAWTVTMIFVVTAWVFFRATSFELAMRIVAAMYDVPMLLNEIAAMLDLGSAVGMPLLTSGYLPLGLLGSLLVCILLKNSNQIVFSRVDDKTISFPFVWLLFSALILVVGVLSISLQEYTEFIYFNF